MARSDRVKVPESRLSSRQYEDALVEFAKSPPDLVDEAEFRKRLRETTIYRYDRANTLLDEIETTLNDVAQRQPSQEGRELKLAIKKIDDAVVQITHGSLAFNKQASSEGIRNILVVTRRNRKVSGRRKK